MDIDLLELLVTRVHEFMRCFGRDDDNLPGFPNQDSRTDRKSCLAFLNDENLQVRMLVQPYASVGGMSTQMKEMSVAGNRSPSNA